MKKIERRQVLNPHTGKLVLESGKVGKEIIRQRKEAEAMRHRAIDPVKTATAAGTSPLDASRVIIPSYHTLMGDESLDAEAAYMEAIETWPSLRANLLQIIQERLEPVLTRLHRRIKKLDDIFFDIIKLGAESAFGEVYTGCIRAGAGCFKVPGLVDATAEHPVRLIIKLLPPVLPADAVPGIPYAGLLEKRGRQRKSVPDSVERVWVGAYNPLREIVMGRFLNQLVRRNVTPHFLMIYESFTVSRPQKDGFAMEMCHFDFSDYMLHLLDVEDIATRSTLLRISLIQLTQGLSAAARHFDFRHNDLHGGNAMVTFITNGVYTYKFGEVYYNVPNAGMCWKMIDFGNASSDVFGAHDNAAAVVHSGAYRRNTEQGHFETEDHAIELFDIARLLGHAAKTVTRLLRSGGATPTQELALLSLHKDLEDFMAITRRIAVASTKRGSIDLATRVWASAVFDFKTPDFVEMVASSSLIEILFKEIAEPYKSTEAGGAIVFDISTVPFTAHERLTGKEAEHFSVNALGNVYPH